MSDRKHVGLTQKIVRVLVEADKPMTAAEIGDVLGIDRSQVSSIITWQTCRNPNASLFCNAGVTENGKKALYTPNYQIVKKLDKARPTTPGQFTFKSPWEVLSA